MFYDDPKNHNMKHNPFKALISPRPIAWVSTVDGDGVLNLAPFSFFNAVSERPQMIFFAPNGPRPSGGEKDTLLNIEKSGEFVVNLCSYDLRDAMNTSSAHVGPEVDEFALAGLTPEPSVHINVPRIKEAPAALECKFLMNVTLPTNNPKTKNNMVIGEVVGIHIDDSIIDDGMINMAKYRPLARLGYMDYGTTDNVFEILRPD